MAIDLYTGRILYSKNANEPRFPASLTKVMTLYLLFDALRDGKISMKTGLPVSAHAAAQSPTKLGLSEGDKIAVADAIGAIVTKSANDMAVTVAEALAGSEQEFARRMTQRARTIGMLNTTFRNASGLPDAEQKTTAQDLIILAKSILADHPERCKVFATKYFQYDGEVYRNHNRLLFTYQGMEGMKTGFTSASGFNLIATARRGDKRLLAVVLGGQSAGARNAAMRNILDHAWPKALTQVAARKAGVLVADLKPRPSPAAPAQNAAANEAKREAPPHKPAAASLALNIAGPLLRLKRRPDRTSASMLLASIEAGLVAKPQPAEPLNPAPVATAAAAADMTTDETATDEPEDKAERAESKSLAYVPPPPQEIARNETLPGLGAADVPKNMSIHYKTVRLPEVTPLAAASLDLPREPEPAAEKPAPAIIQAKNKEEALPQTLAAATVAASYEMDQPGPYHVQVGAFSDQAQAQERLDDVKEALGAAVLNAHPQFIMPVSLPSGVTMFRARLSRFAGEAQAKAICRRLKRSGIECLGLSAH